MHATLKKTQNLIAILLELDFHYYLQIQKAKF